MYVCTYLLVCSFTFWTPDLWQICQILQFSCSDSNLTLLLGGPFEYLDWWRSDLEHFDTFRNVDHLPAVIPSIESRNEGINQVPPFLPPPPISSMVPMELEEGGFHFKLGYVVVLTRITDQLNAFTNNKQLFLPEKSREAERRGTPRRATTQWLLS